MKVGNDSRKYFMINLHERILQIWLGLNPPTSWSQVKCGSNWAIKAGSRSVWKLYGKNIKTVHVQITITWELIGIFACSFLYHDPWNNAFKAITEKTGLEIYVIWSFNTSCSETNFNMYNSRIIQPVTWHTETDSAGNQLNIGPMMGMQEMGTT